MCRFDDVARALQVHALVRRFAKLGVDPGAGRHCAASGEGRREPVRVSEVCMKESDPRDLKNACIVAVHPARDHDYFVAAGGQGTSKMAADKPSSTSDCNPHCLSPKEAAATTDHPRSPQSTNPKPLAMP